MRCPGARCAVSGVLGSSQDSVGRESRAHRAVGLAFNRPAAPAPVTVEKHMVEQGRSWRMRRAVDEDTTCADGALIVGCRRSAKGLRSKRNSPYPTE